ncbi:MAG: hypothetical protein KGS48_05800 [Bacteroidetes bacterium]|nr:hypothetical protein [Bacteroidota bacterium]
MPFSGKKLPILCVFAAFLYACSPVHTRLFIPPATTGKNTLPHANMVMPPDVAGCNNWKNYLPNPQHPEYLPPKIVRVNFQVMNSADSTHNFNPSQARTFLKELLAYANAELDTNVRNWRSPENTLALPKGYKYQICPQPVAGDDGFYFHYDNDLYYFISQGQNANNYARKVIDKYSVGKDSILNIFLMVHPDDSIQSPSYRANGQGIALGTALKLAGLYESKESAHSFDGLINHEIGHIFGLQHAWMEDGCPDTQNHPNKCWAYTEEEPCRSQATNNMMDYNAYQIALTPCQIARINASFANESYIARKCLKPTWCTRNPSMDLVIRDSVSFMGARDLEGNITVAKGGILHISCRVSLPENAYILVEPGGRLWLDGCRLHNACGKKWQGIFIQNRRFERGEVFIRREVQIDNVFTKNRKDHINLD